MAKGKQTKDMKWKIKVLDAANQIIEMVGSSEDFDRVGDRVFMDGVQLTNYQNNPIVLANHAYGDNEKSTCIGKTLNVSVQGEQLIFKIQFADTPNGQEWFYLYANKFMNASSIGFIPLESTPNNQGGYDYTQIELLEISLIAVPCNQTCIQRAYKDKKISKSLYEQIKNNESEVEDMKIEEVKALIAKSVEDAVKPLETKHEEELDTKVKEIEALNVQIVELKKSVLIKAGAAISQATSDAVNTECKGILAHVKCLKSLVNVSTSTGDSSDVDDSEGDPNDSGVKDYSDEEIKKMVSDNVEKLIGEAK